MITEQKGNPLVELLGTQSHQIICNLTSTLGPLNKGFSKELQDSWQELNLKSLKHKELGLAIFKLSRDPKVYIASIICISGFPSKFNKEAFDARAFKACIQRVIKYAKDLNAEVNIAKINPFDLYINQQTKKQIETILSESFSEINLTIWDTDAEE